MAHQRNSQQPTPPCIRLHHPFRIVAWGPMAHVHAYVRMQSRPLGRYPYPHPPVHVHSFADLPVPIQALRVLLELRGCLLHDLLVPAHASRRPRPSVLACLLVVLVCRGRARPPDVNQPRPSPGGVLINKTVSHKHSLCQSRACFAPQCPDTRNGVLLGFRAVAFVMMALTCVTQCKPTREGPGACRHTVAPSECTSKSCFASSCSLIRPLCPACQQTRPLSSSDPARRTPTGRQTPDAWFEATPPQRSQLVGGAH